jgi:hypothetical protein
MRNGENLYMTEESSSSFWFMLSLVVVAEIMLIFQTLEAAQAGLSWATILKKRQGYREAFCDWDVKKIAAFGTASLSSPLSLPPERFDGLGTEHTIL